MSVTMATDLKYIPYVLNISPLTSIDLRWVFRCQNAKVNVKV